MRAPLDKVFWHGEKKRLNGFHVTLTMSYSAAQLSSKNKVLE